MRKELAAFPFGLGIAIIFYILPYRISTMPPWLANLGLAFGGLCIVVSLIIFFWPFKKIKSQQSDIPTKENLVHNMYVEIQKFSEQFKPIRYKRFDEQIYQWNKAHEILRAVHTGLLPHANLILKNTPIPKLIEELYSHVKTYFQQISNLSSFEEEKMKYINSNIPVEEKVVFEIKKAREALNDLDTAIDLLIDRIMNLLISEPKD